MYMQVDWNKDLKLLLSFTRFELAQRLYQFRWVIPVPVMALLAFVVVGAVQAQSASVALAGNAWDVLFSVFDSPTFIFILIIPLYLFLVSDLGGKTEIDALLLPRLGSRISWWAGKNLVLFLLTVFYFLLSVGIVASVATSVLPWQGGWSELVRGVSLGVNPTVLEISPALASGFLLLLLFLGVYSIGLLSHLLTHIYGSGFLGLIAGLLVSLSGFTAALVDVGPPLSYVSIHRYILFNYFSPGLNNSTHGSLPYAILYWLIVLACLLIIGRICIPRRNFFSDSHKLI
jgi:hypothetical protein